MSADEWSIQQHCLSCSRQLASSNYNDRPPATEIKLLVIHNISLPAGCFGGAYIEQLFTNCLPLSADDSFADLEGMEVSSHLLINRQGDVTQFVPFDKRAWHAGVSCFNNCENCNDYSIGLELEGTDDVPYTEPQYQSLVAVTRSLMAAYPGISFDRIVGHSDIAPGRKTDPGEAFDWRYFRELLYR